MVKRYNTELEKDGGIGLPSLTMRSSSIGSWVEYKDYSALEAKCAALAAKINVINELMEVAEQVNKLAQEETEKLAHERNTLAAENTMLKSAHPQPFGPEMMKALDAYEKHQDEAPETGMLDAFFILRDSIRVTTPAADAWVNEQRAVGVEMVVKYHMERAKALKEVDRKGSFNHSSAALDAGAIAEQLRGGRV